MVIFLAINTIVVICCFYECYVTSASTDLFYISKQRKAINILVLFLLAIVSGTRLVGGTDFTFYEQSYNNTPTLLDVINNKALVESNFWISGMDIGYLIITAIIKSLGINFHGYCLIQSLFFSFALYKGLSRYCNNFSVILLVFIAKTFFYDTFISMRQSITIAIFFLALPLIEDRKFIKYLIVCLVCIFIHAGAVILILIYFISLIDIDEKKYKLIIISLLPFPVLNYLHINVLGLLTSFISKVFGMFSSYWSSKADNYTQYNTSGMSLFYVAEYLIIAYLVFINLNSICKDEKKKFSVKVFLCAWPLYTIFGSMSVITREKDYFILFYGIVLCYCLGLNTQKYRQLIMICMVGICIFEFWRYIILFDHGSLLGYRSWLFN